MSSIGSGFKWGIGCLAAGFLGLIAISVLSQMGQSARLQEGREEANRIQAEEVSRDQIAGSVVTMDANLDARAEKTGVPVVFAESGQGRFLSQNIQLGSASKLMIAWKLVGSESPRFEVRLNGQAVHGNSGKHPGEEYHFGLIEEDLPLNAGTYQLLVESASPFRAVIVSR